MNAQQDAKQRSSGRETEKERQSGGGGGDGWWWVGEGISFLIGESKKGKRERKLEGLCKGRDLCEMYFV